MNMEVELEDLGVRLLLPAGLERIVSRGVKCSDVQKNSTFFTELEDLGPLVSLVQYELVALDSSREFKLDIPQAIRDVSFERQAMIHLRRGSECEARPREEREREEMERLMRKCNVSRGDHITYCKNGNQQRALVQNVDYRTETLTITEFSDGKLQRKTLDFSSVNKTYLINLLLQFTGFVPSQNPGHVEQSLSQSLKDPHAKDTMCNLFFNSCGQYVRNCESQSQIDNRTTYDKYNQPIGPKRLSDQLQSEKLQDQNENDKSLHEVANSHSHIISNKVTRQIQSSTSKASLMPSSLQSTVKEHLSLHSETHDQTKSDELLFELLCRALSQSLHNETGQIPSRTSKILLATLCLQSTLSKFNVNVISKEVSLLARMAPCAVLPSRALLVTMFVAAAMLPYIALLVGNLTSVQRTYAGLWRPNELCYC